MGRGGSRRRSGRVWLCVAAAALALAGVLALTLRLTVGRRRSEADFQATFTGRCERFSGGSRRHDCPKIWSAFEQAYVGRQPCNVSMEAYDALIAAAPAEAQCNSMIFWSKTMDMVHALTEKRDCYMSVEETLLGFVLNGLRWCGKRSSSETFTTGCPEWFECVNNPVRSFWSRVSADFAEQACGDVTVMLNGSIATPFSPESVFASVEVKAFNATIMSSLSVALVVTQWNNQSTCANESLKDLEKELHPDIKYSCQEVPESKVRTCISDTNVTCEYCLLRSQITVHDADSTL